MMRLIFTLLLCTALSATTEDPHHSDDSHSGDSHDEHHEHETEDGQLVVFCACFCIFLGLLVEWSLHKFPFLRFLPYTVAIFFIGMLLGGALDFDTDNDFHNSLEMAAAVQPHTFLQIFLPPLLYESASGTNFHLFKRGLSQSLVLAVPGVIINTFLTGAIAWKFYDWSFSEACLFGSIVSATDPVAVVSLLKSMGAPKRLSTLIEAESLLNDGSAFVVWVILADFVKNEEGTAGEIVETALQLSLGGVALGILAGLVSGEWIHNVFEEGKIEIGITILFAYITFFLAEVVCKVSGVLACVFLGLTHVWQNPISAVNEHSLHAVWENFSFFMETIIFFVSGLVVGISMDHLEGEDLWHVVVMYIVLHFTRFVTVCICVPVMNKVGPRVSKEDSAILIYGALRGAIGLALVLLVYYDNDMGEEFRRKILIQVCLLIVMTLLINATTIKYLLIGLGLAEKTLSEQMSARDAKHLLEIEIEECLAEMKSNPRFMGVHWNEVKDALPESLHVSQKEKDLGGDHFMGLLEHSRASVNPTHRVKACGKDITKDELIDIVRRACWRSFKSACELMFEEGTAKRHQVDFLHELVDTAMDDRRLDIEIILQGIERKFEDPPYMLWLYNHTTFSALGSFLLYKKHRHSIEMGYLFIEATQRAATLKLLSRFGMEQGQVFTKINAEFVELQGKVLALLNMFRHEYPDLDKFITTDAAVRNVLSAYRQGVTELHHAGVLEDSVAHEIEEACAECSAHVITSRGTLRSFLGRKDPPVITPEDVFRQTSFAKILHPDEMESLLESAHKQVLHKGDILIRPGSRPDGFYILAKGVFSSGHIFFVAGDSLIYNAVTEQSYQLKIEAYSNDCVVYHVNHGSLEDLCANPMVAEHIYRMAAGQFLRVLFFKENLCFDVGKIFEGKKSDYRWVEMDEKPMHLQIENVTFLLKGEARKDECDETCKEDVKPMYAPAIMKPAKYIFDPGCIFFTLHKSESMNLNEVLSKNPQVNTTKMVLRRRTTFINASLMGAKNMGLDNLDLTDKNLDVPQLSDYESSEEEKEEAPTKNSLDPGQFSPGTMIANRMSMMGGLEMQSWEQLAGTPKRDSQLRMSLQRRESGCDLLDSDSAPKLNQSNSVKVEVKRKPSKPDNKSHKGKDAEQIGDIDIPA